MQSERQIEIKATCLCRSHTFTTTVPASSLPLPASCCHCDSCRRNTGALYFPCTPWPGWDSAAPNIDLSSLHAYSFSETTTLYSCGSCGSQMFVWCRGALGEGVNGDGETLEVLTGCLSDLGEEEEGGGDLVRYTSHIFVGDTLDGGATIWFSHYDGGDGDNDGDDDKGKRKRERIPIPRWAGHRDRSLLLDEGWPFSSSSPPTTDPEQIKLQTKAKLAKMAYPEYTPLRCHCGGIDLLVRSGADILAASQSTGTNLPAIVDPESGRYLAISDACESCRLSFGSDVANWTFVPLDHVFFPTGTSSSSSSSSSPPVSSLISLSSSSKEGQQGEKQEKKAGEEQQQQQQKEKGNNNKNEFPKSIAALKGAVQLLSQDPPSHSRDQRLGTLALYESTRPDVVDRYFCHNCAATVFYSVYDSEDDRLHMVNVAVGLLRHPDGARAEGLLTWNLGVVGWMDDNTPGGWRRTLNKIAAENVEEWRVRRGYPKSWRRLRREALEAAAAAAAVAISDGGSEGGVTAEEDVEGGGGVR